MSQMSNKRSKASGTSLLPFAINAMGQIYPIDAKFQDIIKGDKLIHQPSAN